MVKGNPFRQINPMQRMMQVAQQARQMQNNPSMIGKYLFDQGRIDQTTYDAIKGMNSPSQIGNYLMNNGILGQQQVNQMAQAVPKIQSMMQS